MANTLKYFFTLACFLAGHLLLGQKLSYEHLDSESGLSNPFVNTINKGVNGYIFIGTGEGLFRYNGFEFVSFDKEDGLSEDIIESSFEDSEGNLWLGHKNGGITIYNGESFRVLPLEPYTESKIVGFTEDAEGNIWAASQNDGLLRFDKDFNIWQFVSGFEDFALHCISVLNDEVCIAGSDMGAVFFSLPNDKNQSINVEMILDVPLTNVHSMTYRKDEKELIVAADDEGLFAVSASGDQIIVEELFPELELDRFQYYNISLDPSGRLWLGTRGNSLWQLQFGDQNNQKPSLINYNEENSLGADNVKAIFTDNEGNTWVGSFGKGLYKLEPTPLVFCTYGKSADEDDIFSVYHQNDEYWLGGLGRVYQTRTNLGHLIKEFNTKNGIPRDKVTCLIGDSLGNLWMGTRSSGLFLKTAGDTLFQKVELARGSLANIINDLEVHNGKLFVATSSGLFILENSEVIDHLTVASGLPHNSVKAMAIFQEELWIAAKGSLLSKWTEDGLESVNVPVDDRLMQISTLVPTSDGELIITTLGNGVIILNANNEWQHFVRENGLLSDYCYSAIKTKNNRIWVGHNGGLSFYEKSSGWQVFKETEDLDCSTYSGAIFTDRESNVAVGTDQGLLYYISARDVINHIEPSVLLTNVSISDSSYNYKNEINLKHGTYRLRVDFLGLSYQNPEEVKYSYILEGHDPGWSTPSTSRDAIYNRLDAGTYTFKVKAFNSDGVGGDNIKSFTIFVDKPFWLKWWFFVIVVVFILLLVRFIIARRLRFLEANQEYLKKELNARSKEVLSQKELLEQKNKDITDSIIYAKHIQTAMMPSENELHKCFPESFVFYRPRDIVSGDFYWVKEFEEKIVLACADCAGHGVPGAFMSLISTSLLKEVSNTRDIDSPAKAMDALQKEMRRTLSQDEQNALRDGMDVSLVELDKKTKTVRVASARRPVIIYQNGKRLELPGNRLSIGDAVNGDDYSFSEHEIQLASGDLIYLFSDGIQDQFGGERGKKLKKKGLLNLLDDLTEKNMFEQNEDIARKFMEWKGSLDQVDDVILIGVRIE
jgi:ligand-binding sensor domain-containing protein/serine phosphatase RsbU (regulator of sigma subunit)